MKLSNEFICKRKDRILSVLSIYPDHNEIYKFEGKVADILEECFAKDKILTTDEIKELIKTELIQDDWDRVIDFLKQKKIIV